MAENVFIGGAIADLADCNDHNCDSIVRSNPEVVIVGMVIDPIEMEVCAFVPQELELFQIQLQLAKEAKTTDHKNHYMSTDCLKFVGSSFYIDRILSKTKIADFAWLQPSNLFVATTKALHLAFYEFNALLKDYDPYPNFPLPAVDAQRGVLVRATSMYRSYTPQSFNSYSATNSYSASNSNNQRASNQNRPLSGSGNVDQANPFHAPNYWTSTPPFIPPSASEVRESFLGTGGAIPLESRVPSYSQIGDTNAFLNSFSYKPSASFAYTPLTNTNPYTSPLSQASYATNTYTSPLSQSSFSTNFGSQPMASLSNVEFAPPKTFSQPHFEPLKFEPIAMPKCEPLRFDPPAIPHFEQAIPGIDSRDFGRLQAQYEAEQEAKLLAELDAFLKKESETHYISFDEQSHKRFQEERFYHAATKDQALKEISAELRRLYRIFYAHNMWMDISYIRNVLSLPIEGIINILENGFLADMLLEKARINSDELGRLLVKLEVSGIRLLSFIKQNPEPNPEARRQYAEMQAQAAKEISAELKHLYSTFYAHNIWVDINYLHNILGLPIEDIISLLQNGLLADMLLERAKIKPWTTGQATTVLSGTGGKDCGDLAAQAEFDKLPATLSGSEGGNHDGHAYRKHVGQTLEQFLERFTNEPDRKELSSFLDVETAEKAYRKVLDKAKKAICKWLSKNGGGEDFEVSFLNQIGYGLRRDDTTPSPRWRARFVFTRTQDGPRIITAYPIE